MVLLDPPAGRRAGRQRDRRRLGRPNPDESDVVLQFYDPTTKKFTQAPTSGVNGVARPPGPGVAAGRQVPAVRPNGRDGRGGARRSCATTRSKADVAALTGPGYLQPVVVARRQVHRRDQDDGLRHRTSSSSTARPARSSCALTDDGASWAPVWSPAGDAIAFLHIDGQTVDLRLAKLDGDAPGWTVGETIDLTRSSGLDAARGRLVHPGRPAAGDPAAARSPDRGPERLRQRTPPRASDRRVRDGDRTSSGSRPGSRGDRHRPLPRPRPRPGGLPAGFAARPRRRSSGSRRSSLEAAAAACRRGQAEPRVLRGVRLGRDGRARAAPGDASRRTCRSWPTPSAATSARPPPARPSRSSTASAPTRSRSTRTSARRRSRRSSSALDRFAYVAVPDVEPGRRRAPGPASWPRTRRRGAPARAAPRAGRPARDGLGTGRDRRARRRRDGAGGARRDPGHRARVWPFLVPGVGAQGGEHRAGARRRARDRGAGRRSTGRRPARQRLAGHRRSGAADGAPGDPFERVAAAAADWAATPPCATLAAAVQTRLQEPSDPCRHQAPSNWSSSSSSRC